MLACCADAQEYRSLDGTGNNKNNPSAGSNSQPYKRLKSVNTFYSDANQTMLQTPATPVNCSSALATNVYPLPRCVSNLISRYGIASYDPAIASFSSKRQISHMVTFFGQFIIFDLVRTQRIFNGDKVYIPTDDATYQIPNSAAAKLSSFTSLPFNRSANNPPPSPDAVGTNQVSVFLDLNQIYGESLELSMILRDSGSGRGKLKTSSGSNFPAFDNSTSTFITGAPITSQNIFTLAVASIWIGEHNAKCDKLYSEHGAAWDDETYFQEARRWTIGLYQKVVTEEYLGAILGQPLPPYQAYNDQLMPAIDAFFLTVTLRYGHSEISNLYNMQNLNGEVIATVPLSRIQDHTLLPKFGLAETLRSMATQSQQQVSVFVPDEARGYQNPFGDYADVAAWDLNRARDFGIPLYNDMRAAFGLPRQTDWSGITSNDAIATRLQNTYGSVDKLEAYVGAFSEDPQDGSNFGQLLTNSILDQYSRLRDSDRFWYENTFTDDERAQVRNTTFRDLIMLHASADGVPQNIWSLQTTSLSNVTDTDKARYPSELQVLSPPYSIRWNIQNEDINFMVDFGALNGWFGMGFGSEDGGMIGADFIITTVKNGNATVENYKSVGYNRPVLDSNQDVKFVKATETASSVKVEFARSLAASSPNRKEIIRGSMPFIIAYGTDSDNIGYHMNNRRSVTVNFFTAQSDVSIDSKQRQIRLAHGIGMIIAWSFIFPISIFLVRFYKHTFGYLQLHRNLQILGGFLVAIFGTAAIASLITFKRRHNVIGLILYSFTFFELILGLITLWGQRRFESVNEGIPRFLKRAHRYVGASMMVLAVYNQYLGIQLYAELYSINFEPYGIAYAVYTSFVILLFLLAQLWKTTNGGFISKFQRKKPVSEGKETLQVHVANEKLVGLPEWSWDEVNERVQRGAFLVVCDGFVADIRKWFNEHPGGTKILERVIGTDITNDFYNTHKLTQQEDEDDGLQDVQIYCHEQPAPLVSPILGKYSQLWQHHNIHSSFRQRKLSKVIDSTNMNLFHKLRAPIAKHTHSAFATVQFSKMIVAKIADDHYSVASDEDSTRFESYFRPQSHPYFEQDLAKNPGRRVFRRYQLSDKTWVNASEQYPVIKFTFTKIHQSQRFVGDRFLPGDYVELQARVKEQVVVRSYTPLEGRMSTSFSIYVKVYPTGLMSRHLRKQRIGYEVKVRGPFDVADRVGYSHLSQNELSTIMGRRPRTRASTITSEISDVSSHMLLNSESADGCWDELFMIAGGTGITPMLIKYHLKTVAANAGRAISMHLLYANNYVEDIIDGLELEGYAARSNGMLTTTYILNYPPAEGWDGLRGRITLHILQSWLNHHETINRQRWRQSSQGPITVWDRTCGHTDNGYVASDVYGHAECEPTPENVDGEHEVIDNSEHEVIDNSGHEVVDNSAHELVDHSNRNSKVGSVTDSNTLTFNEGIEVNNTMTDTQTTLPINQNSQPTRIQSRAPRPLSFVPITPHNDVLGTPLSSSYSPTMLNRNVQAGSSPSWTPIAATPSVASPWMSAFQISKSKIVVCGPDGMMNTVFNILKDLGYAEDEIILLY
ncbi:2813_t:CDS:10 [Paraglomus occultum]|uniref:2813_t:CDS:1 n=1 Tax=Paraglomus occultum TaxID=144539 RepID=A0A9N9FL83_9GLOM|nr:2813_t:CDS:10 [Paraglomus occultum]